MSQHEGSSTAVVQRDRGEMEIAEKPGSGLLSAIRQVVGAGPIDSAKMDVLERMLAMQERIEERNEKREFFEALARVQAECPRIHKGKRGAQNGVMYAPIEDIDRITRPLLAKEGFSISFDEVEAADGKTTFMATLSRGAHSETKRRTLPTDRAATNRDGKPTRSAIQDEVSTTSYARRLLLVMHLAIITTDADDDGAEKDFITEDQVRDIETGISDTKSNLDSFLRLIAGAPSIAEIPKRDYNRVMNALNEKRRNQR